MALGDTSCFRQLLLAELQILATFSDLLSNFLSVCFYPSPCQFYFGFINLQFVKDANRQQDFPKCLPCLFLLIHWAVQNQTGQFRRGFSILITQLN